MSADAGDVRARDPLGRLLAVSVDLRGGSIELADRVSAGPEDLPLLLATLRGRVAEAMLISTCHRLELYAVPLAEAPFDPAAELARMRGVREGELEPLLRTFSGPAAGEHLFRVAAGLESSSLGENEVLGQVRAAWRAAREAGMAGPLLDLFARSALNCGKRARSETAISGSSISLAGTAIELAAEAAGGLRGRRIAVVGSGEMAQRVLHALQGRGASGLIVVARNHAARERLAVESHARPRPWEELRDAVTGCSAVFVATGASQPLIGTRELDRCARPLAVVDLALPRNVQPEVGGLEGVQMFDISDVTARLEKNRRVRGRAVEAVERLVGSCLDTTLESCAARAAVPLITSLRRHAEAVRDDELARTLAQLGDLPEREREVVRALAHRLVNRLLHRSLAEVKRPGPGRASMEATRR